MGALAGNPADLVARLPGVVGDSVGGDIRYVSRDKEGSTDDYFGPNPSTHLAANPQQWQENVALNRTNSLLGKRTFTEKVKAAYVMGNVDLGKVSVMGGVRVEKTETSGTGAKNDLTAAERATQRGVARRLLTHSHLTPQFMFGLNGRF
ncbi:MAG: hypothetical protein HY736_20075 [Verrucomicrobia bacterium]|nr:hypothetical protein [Verrucomicrobiota bacterium]